MSNNYTLKGLNISASEFINVFYSPDDTKICLRVLADKKGSAFSGTNITTTLNTAKSSSGVDVTERTALNVSAVYASMRVFCIGLGLVGKEYTLCRKLLMSDLEGNSSWRHSEPKTRKERVYKEVVSVRFTPDTLAKLAELASQSNMSRNAFIESVVCEYVQAETVTE